MPDATAHDESGSTVPGRTAFALPNVITAVEAGDFEGAILVGLGVQQQTTFQVERPDPTASSSMSRSASRRAPARSASWTGTRTSSKCSVGCPPPRRPRRCCSHSSPALHRRSGRTDSAGALGRAWGFDHLSISGGVARLRLTGAAGSGGSTTTVANEIVPTLRQFPSVDWVKIFGPGGHTEPRRVRRTRSRPASSPDSGHASVAAADRAGARGRRRTPSRRGHRPARPCGCCSP